jgi:hypothetical protein
MHRTGLAKGGLTGVVRLCEYAQDWTG